MKQMESMMKDPESMMAMAAGGMTKEDQMKFMMIALFE